MGTMVAAVVVAPAEVVVAPAAAATAVAAAAVVAEPTRRVMNTLAVTQQYLRAMIERIRRLKITPGVRGLL